MSRTDVHRPWAVQKEDSYNRHLFYRYPAWPWQVELVSYRNLGCGCRLCTGHYWRLQERRRDRHWTQARLRDARLTAAEHRDEIDIPARTPWF